MAQTDRIVIRPLRSSDPHMISAAFQALNWNKPVELYERYLVDIKCAERHAIVAYVNDEFAGYITIVWTSEYAPFRAAGIPEMKDLNVLPSFRRRGVATRLLEAMEQTAALRTPTVGLGVGVSQDYGAAQRLYIQRGYIPDGRGVAYINRNVVYGEQVTVDDDLVLFLTKQVAA